MAAMKPLPVALLTPLDVAIWLRVDARMDGEREYAMHTESLKADRRDAALMFDMQRYPWALIFGLPCSVHWVEGLEIRGRFRGRGAVPGAGCNITCCT